MDDLPLANIDMIVDMLVGYGMYSLMDNFCKYNQIKIIPANKLKMSFKCPWGTFYWNVMHFSLNDVGTTYQ